MRLTNTRYFQTIRYPDDYFLERNFDVEAALQEESVLIYLWSGCNMGSCLNFYLMGLGR